MYTVHAWEYKPNRGYYQIFSSMLFVKRWHWYRHIIVNSPEFLWRKFFPHMQTDAQQNIPNRYSLEQTSQRRSSFYCETVAGCSGEEEGKANGLMWMSLRLWSWVDLLTQKQRHKMNSSAISIHSVHPKPGFLFHCFFPSTMGKFEKLGSFFGKVILHIQVIRNY